jgi:hypothetical protein
MTEIGLAEFFSMGEAIGITGTLFVVLYFSRKQTQSLSIDIETKVLNDLAERSTHHIVDTFDYGPTYPYLRRNLLSPLQSLSSHSNYISIRYDQV